MNRIISCDSCKTSLSLNMDVKPDAKVKCPKCGHIIGNPTKTVLAEEQIKASPNPTRPKPSQSPSWGIPAPVFLIPPFGSILITLLALLIPIFFGQYLVALIVSCLAAVGSVLGMALLVIGKSRPISVHLAGSAVSAAAIFLAVNAMMLKSSIETNEDLRTKNERVAAQAKTDLDEAKNKLAGAEDAKLKADEVLKKADEAPKKAEAFYKSAKDVQEKTKATEKRTAELLAQTEEAKEKNDQDRKKIMDDMVKVEIAEKNLKITQKNIDKAQKDIEEKRQELVTMKKENEADKKRGEDELAALKKDIDADKKKAEEKQKEVKDLLKKVETTLKGAALKLKDKNPLVRANTATNLGKLPVIPEVREFVGESLVEAMLDPVPAVRNAANETLATIDPAIHPHVLTLILSNGKDAAVKGAPKGVTARRELEKLGKEAKCALPVLIVCFNQAGVGEANPDQYKPVWLESLAAIAPADKRVVQIVLNEVTRTPERKGLHFTKHKAMNLLDVIEADKKDKVKALMTVVTYRGNEGQSANLAVLAIEAIEKIGLPEASDAVPLLKKMRFSSPDADVRMAATKALEKIDKGK